jgi:pimeloyl-ACP methyl ester carboxylesterase
VKKVLLRIARIGAFVYLGLMLFLAACQNRLLYFPSRGTQAALIEQATAEGLQPWKDSTGAVIGWRTTNQQATRRIVVFHGNAGYALHRTYYTEALSRLGWDVFLFEYPGYGARGGNPGREAFLSSGRAAIEELLGTDARPLFLLGESVGSGTAAALAAELPGKIRGIALVIPFARLVEVARWHFPYLPVGLLLRDKYDNIAALEKYHGPIIFVIAEKDEVVSPQQGRKLHDAYAGPKRLITLSNATHNAFPTNYSAAWWKEVSDFLGSSP